MVGLVGCPAPIISMALVAAIAAHVQRFALVYVMSADLAPGTDIVKMEGGLSLGVIEGV